MGTRKDAQAVVRLAKEQAAHWQDVADKGGPDAEAARGLADVTAQIADQRTRALARNR